MRADVTVDEWVAALESGAYHHNIGSLRVEQPGFSTLHCCLGVLLDIAGCRWAPQPSRINQGQMVCVEIDEGGSIPFASFDLLGPEIAGVLNHPVPDSDSQVGHDLLVAVNDESEEGYVPAIKVLRRLQEEVV